MGVSKAGTETRFDCNNGKQGLVVSESEDLYESRSVTTSDSVVLGLLKSDCIKEIGEKNLIVLKKSNQS